MVSIFFIRKSLFNGICQHNLTKEGSAAISKRSLQSQFDFLRLNLLTIGM
nr:MAG TPA: hypothetical protein [Caudoviricetes sp.]